MIYNHSHLNKYCACAFVQIVNYLNSFAQHKTGGIKYLSCYRVNITIVTL